MAALLATRSAPRNSSWSKARGNRGVTGWPPIESPARAACTFAGKSATSSSARPAAAQGAVLGMSRPMAPASSAIPVSVTSSSGFGSASGTMRTRSGRRLPQ